MLESVIHMVTRGAEAGHSPQTAVAAVMCALLVSFFS
ncbi:YshB family small membrane protein [Enterobacter sp. Ap-1006]|nr:YshB family small membrane protein [Enterobacter sp. Ap-1006]NIF50249.1 YshB family small membrane protein [Enterobacter sp. Ap-1006]